MNCKISIFFIIIIRNAIVIGFVFVNRVAILIRLFNLIIRIVIMVRIVIVDRIVCLLHLGN